MSARAGPSGYLCPSAESYGCGTRSAQTVLADASDSAPGRSPAQGGKTCYLTTSHDLHLSCDLVCKPEFVGRHLMPPAGRKRHEMARLQIQKENNRRF